jgi:hypothetical protein
MSQELGIALELTCDLCQVGGSVSYLYKTPVFRINDRAGYEVISVPSRWMICRHCHPLIRELRFDELLERVFKQRELRFGRTEESVANATLS